LPLITQILKVHVICVSLCFCVLTFTKLLSVVSLLRLATYADSGTNVYCSLTKGVSSSTMSAKCIGRHGTRTSFIRITSKETLKMQNSGCPVDHCYTYHTSLDMIPTMPQCSDADTAAFLVSEQPHLGLHLDDVDLPSHSEQDADCDVRPLTCEDIPGSLSSCSLTLVTAGIKAEDMATSNCGSDKESDHFQFLLSNSTSASDDHLSKDTGKIIEAVQKMVAGNGARRQGGSAVRKERVIHSCDHCGKSFVRRKEYIEHRRCHTGEKPFHCETCGRGFSRFRSVAEHRRQHTNERPFVCDICAKQFYTSGELLKHRRYHSGDKRYHCTICGQRFLRCGEYTDHCRVHSGQNVCPLCGKAFTRLHNMKEHMNSAHAGSRRYSCKMCGKRFAYSSGLRYHRRLHKEDRPFKCQECGKCFARMGELNRHRRGTHKIVALSAPSL